jgi:hypothetical protein
MGTFHFTSTIAVAAMGFLALTSGCASVTRGTKDTLVVETEPAGARVRLSTGQTGTTPTSFKLPRKNDVDVHIEKEGFEPVNSRVTSQISGKGAAGMAGNVLVGGIIGAGVDAYSGATKDLRPNPLRVKLVPLKPGVPSETTSADATPVDPSADARGVSETQAQAKARADQPSA